MIFHKLPDTDFDGNRKLFPKKSLELEPNTVYCLVGCNGSGKTTLVDYMIENLRKKGAEKAYDRLAGLKRAFTGKEFDFTKCDNYYISFDRKSEDGINEDYFISKAMTTYCSTGESIITRFGGVLGILGDFIRKPEYKNKNLFIFFDDCDAGTSLDVICEIIDVVNMIKDDCAANGITYYFILTANSYEIARNCQCIDVNTFKPISFKDYEDYKKFVLKSKARKDKSFKEEEDNDGL